MTAVTEFRLIIPYTLLSHDNQAPSAVYEGVNDFMFQGSSLIKACPASCTSFQLVFVHESRAWLDEDGFADVAAALPWDIADTALVMRTGLRAVGLQICCKRFPVYKLVQIPSDSESGWCGTGVEYRPLAYESMKPTITCSLKRTSRSSGKERLAMISILSDHIVDCIISFELSEDWFGFQNVL